MDITRVIGELRQELAQLERCLVELENLRQIQGSRTQVKGLDGALQRRRGRKFMGPEERKQVSARMKRYWASRRKA